MPATPPLRRALELALPPWRVRPWFSPHGNPSTILIVSADGIEVARIPLRRHGARAGQPVHFTGRDRAELIAELITVAVQRLASSCPVAETGHKYKRTATEDGFDHVCECGAHCPHEWPDDLREEGGAHHCKLCGADGLA